jgi:hypothetical protein
MSVYRALALRRVLSIRHRSLNSLASELSTLPKSIKGPTPPQRCRTPQRPSLPQTHLPLEVEMAMAQRDHVVLYCGQNQ